MAVTFPLPTSVMTVLVCTMSPPAALPTVALQACPSNALLMDLALPPMVLAPVPLLIIAKSVPMANALLTSLPALLSTIAPSLILSAV
jgi:hypothetical protein